MAEVIARLRTWLVSCFCQDAAEADLALDLRLRELTLARDVAFLVENERRAR